MKPTGGDRPLGAWTAAALFAVALATSAPIWWRFAVPILDGVNWPKHPGHVPALFGDMLGGILMIWTGAGAQTLPRGYGKSSRLSRTAYRGSLRKGASQGSNFTDWRPPSVARTALSSSAKA